MNKAVEIEIIKPFGVIVHSKNGDQSVFDLNAAELRELFNRHQLVVLRGFKSLEKQQLIQFSASLGEISMWPFGEVLELVEQEKPEDHIFDNNYVPLHWDGMYRPQVPEIQVFHCVSAPGENHGGETTFSNTSLLLGRLSDEKRKKLEKVTAYYERKMEYYQSKTVAPIVNSHPDRDLEVIRYCEPPKADDDSFINHPGFELRGLNEKENESFQNLLRDELYSLENFYAHSWKTGDVVLSDNYTLLHGRNRYTSGAPRHLRRVHVLGRPALDNPHLLEHK